jgi:hypothetical protein
VPTPVAPSALWGALLVGGGSFAVDQPIVQDATFGGSRANNATYFSYLDSQARAAQTHIIQSLIGGLTATWRVVDGASAAVSAGDVLCLAGSSSGTVTRAVSAALANAPAAFGIALQAAPPGGSVPIACNGLVSPAITGLASGTGFLYVRVGTVTARAQLVASLGPTDYPLGTADAAGNLALRSGQFPPGAGGSIAGDVTGTLAASVVSAISGSSPINVTPASLQWTQGTTFPQWTQAQQANGAAPQNITMAPQAAGAAATNATNGTPGSFAVNVSVPVNGGAEAVLLYQRASTTMSALGTLGANSQALWLGSTSAGSRSTSNYTLRGDNNGAATVLSSGSTVYLRINDALAAGIYTANGLQLFGESAQFGGGVGVLGMSNAVTNPSTPGGTGLVLACTAASGIYAAGALMMRGYAGTATEIASPGSGSLNTQNATFLDRTAYLRTAATTATTIYTTPSFATSRTVTLIAYVNSSDQTTPSNACGAIVSATYYNNGGTMTQVGATTTIANHNYTTPPAFTVTGATINVQVSAKAANSTDHQARIIIVYN